MLRIFGDYESLSFIMLDWFDVKFTLMVLFPSQMLVYLINAVWIFPNLLS